MDIELLRAAAYLEGVLEAGIWAAGTDTSVKTWGRYEDVLARSLRRDDFHFLALAVQAAERAPPLFAAQVAADELAIVLSDTDRDALRHILRMIQHGQVVLGQQLGPWPKETLTIPPTLQPEEHPGSD